MVADTVAAGPRSADRRAGHWFPRRVRLWPRTSAPFLAITRRVTVSLDVRFGHLCLASREGPPTRLGRASASACRFAQSSVVGHDGAVPRDLAASAPELARSLRAIYEVSRAAASGPQRAAATQAADRWTVMAVNAGWTRTEIAAAVDAHPSSINGRVSRQRRREPHMPPLRGVLAVPAPPLSARTQERLHRSQLIGPAEVARLVGCRPGSVAAWATARGVPFDWTPGQAKRLYGRAEVIRAAGRRPLQRHPNWHRRRNVAVPPQLRGGDGQAVRAPNPE